MFESRAVQPITSQLQTASQCRQQTLFNGYDHFYATLAHELSHWTGHKITPWIAISRTDLAALPMPQKNWWQNYQARFWALNWDLPVSSISTSHASYIASWLKLLKKDDRAMLTAAARAEEASNMLLHLGGPRGQ